MTTKRNVAPKNQNPISPSTISADDNLSIANIIARLKTKIKAEKAKSSCHTFTLFPKLPTELQSMIWMWVINDKGRLVTLKPSIPAFLQACSDSRQLAFKAGYQIHTRSGSTYALKFAPVDECSRDPAAFKPDLDILFLDRTSFPPVLEYHYNAVHTLTCSRVKKAMLRPVRRLALSVREVTKIWKTQCFHCFLRRDFEGLFPDLEELIIILRPGSLGADFNDLYEVEEGAATTMDSAYLKKIMTDISRTFTHAKQEDRQQGVELKFMRMETFVR